MGGKPKNQFGYNHNKSGLPQLARILNIRPNSFEADELKVSLKELSRKYLDISLTSTAQSKVFQHIEKELVAEHPDLFEACKEQERRIYFAMRTIMGFHNERRGLEGVRKQRGKENSVQGIVIKEEPIDIVDLKELGNISKTPPLPQMSQCPTRKRLPIPTRMGLKKESPASPKLAYARMFSTAESHTIGLPSQARRSIAGTQILRDIEGNRSDNTGIATVREFLKTCIPSMERYLTAFVDFGCTSEGHLRSFAKFTQEKRYSMLGQLLNAYAGGEEFTEMDIAILESQLETYFL